MSSPSEKKKKASSSKSLVQSNKEPLGKKKTFQADGIVVRELRDLYVNRLLPIEKTYLFSKFHLPEILDAELGAKPTVLLVGQYSTGKTSFIRNLIGQDYPEIHIGPEPTTDRFIAVVHGEDLKTIKGNALTGVSDLPFAGLSVFGSGFLNKFCAAVLPAPLLKDINIIDTPGVLSGEKQRTSRGYDFAKVSRWFAERSDLILLMFDPSKLDISDEFKSVIEELQPHEDKVHCVLNKADSLDTESLMRVYGALLWSMGKVFRGAEVTRVYVGSFRDEPLVHEEHAALFDKDRDVLMGRLHDLPRACGMRKVNEMVKRIRLAIVNVCVLGYLRSKLPYLWGREAIQLKLIEKLPEVFETVRRQYGLAEGDFPKIDEFRQVLCMSDFRTFPHTNREVLVKLQDILTDEIPRIIQHVAGVVKEGPAAVADEVQDEGDGDDDNGDDATGGVSANSNNNNNKLNVKAPKLFTINTDTTTMAGEKGSSGVLFFALQVIVSVVVLWVAIVVASYYDEFATLQLLKSQLDRFLAATLPSVPVTATTAK